MHQSLASRDGTVEQLRFAHIEDSEPPERYASGGYHPLSIGNVLNQRYHIVHKLGFGSYSTTWLAKDAKSGDKYAAIKIKTAASSLDAQETQIWQHLWSAANAARPEAPPRSVPDGLHSVHPIWDEFMLDGPNGTHRCIVTAPARMTVAEAQYASYTRLFQPRVARAIAAQLIQAVAFVHAQGYVHGDLHLGNCLFRFPTSLGELSPAQFDEVAGTPVQESVRIIGQTQEQPLPPGVPSHIVIPAWFGTRSEDVQLQEASILLSDFGEAFSPVTEKRHRSNTPLTLRPPEVRFDVEKPLSFSADIWTLACSIWTVLGQRSLFDIFSFTDDYVTSEQVDALGKLPQQWWESWEARSSYFDCDANLLDHKCKRMSLEDRFENSIQRPRRECGMEPASEEEKRALLCILKAMLAFIPEERPTAESLLECEWMTKWALPDLAGVDKRRSDAGPD